MQMTRPKCKERLQKVTVAQGSKVKMDRRGWWTNSIYLVDNYRSRIFLKRESYPTKKVSLKSWRESSEKPQRDKSQ